MIIAKGFSTLGRAAVSKVQRVTVDVGCAAGGDICISVECGILAWHLCRIAPVYMR